ncbi:MAG: hypothetical protein IPJ04_18620, partial [Candidatus Eisenbacteria bacterium]|nr:hypothetical protein [Candidatus Eisenbacteria bacterium]
MLNGNEAATKKLTELLPQQEGVLGLRLSAIPGGCSGYQCTAWRSPSRPSKATGSASSTAEGVHRCRQRDRAERRAGRLRRDAAGDRLHDPQPERGAFPCGCVASQPDTSERGRGGSGGEGAGRRRAWLRLRLRRLRLASTVDSSLVRITLFTVEEANLLLSEIRGSLKRLWRDAEAREFDRLETR